MSMELETTKRPQRKLLQLSACSFVAALMAFFLQLPYSSATPVLFAAVLIFIGLGIVSLVCHVMSVIRGKFFKNDKPPVDQKTQARKLLIVLAVLTYGMAAMQLFSDHTPNTSGRWAWLRSSIYDATGNEGLALCWLALGTFMLLASKRGNVKKT